METDEWKRMARFYSMLHNMAHRLKLLIHLKYSMPEFTKRAIRRIIFKQQNSADNRSYKNNAFASFSSAQPLVQRNLNKKTLIRESQQILLTFIMPYTIPREKSIKIAVKILHTLYKDRISMIRYCIFCLWKKKATRKLGSRTFAIQFNRSSKSKTEPANRTFFS